MPTVDDIIWSFSEHCFKSTKTVTTCNICGVDLESMAVRQHISVHHSREDVIKYMNKKLEAGK